MIRRGAIAAGLIAAFLAGSASAEEGPVPFGKIGRDAAESMIVDGLGKVPLGQIPVAGYKLAMFAKDVGNAAVEKEERTRDGDIMLMRADAALLKGLVAQGEGNGEKAEAAKARLREVRDRLDSQDPGDINYLLNITAKNFGYAVTRASIKLALDMGLKKLLSWDPIARFVDKYIHFGDEPASLIGNRSALKPLLMKAGWKKFGARADIVERFVDKATDKLLDKLVEDTMNKEIAKISSNALDSLYSRVMDDHPSQPVMRRRVRYELVANPAVFAPLAMPAPPPPIPAAAAAPAPAPAAPTPRSDPVAQIIYTEDSYVRGSWRTPESSEPTTYTAPPETPSEPEEPSAQQIELHEELGCVGAGNKPGCEKWNSSSGASVEGCWDGNANCSLYNR